MYTYFPLTTLNSKFRAVIVLLEETNETKWFIIYAISSLG